MRTLCFVLIILLFYSLFIVYKNKSDIIQLNKFDLNTLQPLKGILIILVMMSHLTQYFKFDIVKDIAYNGPYANSVFFFISGYGLYKSYVTKTKYLDHFLMNRLKKLLPPLIIVTIVFLIYRFSFENYQLSDIIQSIKKGGTLTPYTWFIYAIIIYYVFFFIIFKHIRTQAKAIFALFIFIFAYIWMIKLLNWSAYWYNSSLCFPLGFVYFHYEHTALKLYNKKYFKLLCIIYSIYILLLLYCMIGTFMNWPAKGTIIYNMIPLFILPIIYTLNIGKSHFLNFTGKISYQLYIVHGIFIYFFRYKHDLISMSLIIISSYLVAFILQKTCSLKC